MTNAYVDEIFSSIQGEGLRIGERHIFVRFHGCDLRCRYCDTPAAIESGNRQFCRAQNSLNSFAFERVANSLSAAVLTDRCSRLFIPGPARPVLSLTGGEPLLQKDFLLEWLPRMRRSVMVYLETSGIRFMEMALLHDLIDVVSMDFKLPSATGLQSYWDEHQRFLSAAMGKEIIVKAVVTKDTEQVDIVTAAQILADAGRPIPLVLQPAAGAFAPDTAALFLFQEIALKLLSDVRIIPQMHKVMGVP